MAIEPGDKVKGRISGITHFGAFVELADGKTGLVHISEVADKYVDNIKDFVNVGDEVTVKVMKVEESGKISLSIRKAVDRPPESRPKPVRPSNARPKDNSRRSGSAGSSKPRPLSFEDKMNNFMKDSEERLSSLRKQTDNKRGKHSRK
ncbi:S1 RNA binding domain protein [Sinobaca qinghaiensis]|uniref:S1 RNA binding domain protein n=1 Tax=Sinobaca qinghaiensis TaxID=342944 RepID=A0A419VTZ0_9BACL|nr:S1 domain-containing RNA-binding protein [Sinobaca qinghaiensis]RKD84149.1 S1 RNA binding domain protein [Sinobaca qinghaiensis]